MTNDTNAKLAEAMDLATRDGYSPTATLNMRMLAMCGFSSLRLCAPGPAVLGIPPGCSCAIKASPATSRDAFATHVQPELERRGLLEAWAQEVRHATPSELGTSTVNEMIARALSAPASVLCEAALAVMGGGDG